MSQLPSDSITGSVSNKSADDIFKELGKDDQDSLDLTTPLKKPADEKVAKPKDDEEDEEEKDKDKDEDDELSDIEEDLEDIDSEKLELTTPVRRKEILKKYPELFKDFPYLEKAYYREQQFTEILSTIDDAKEAAESHQVLQRYTEDMVEKGNIHNVLKMIKDTNPDTYAEVVDNYLEHLKMVDQAAYTHVQSNLVKNIILGMVDEAKTSGDDDLKTAALLLNKWAFGSSKFTPPYKMSKSERASEDGDKGISKREQEFAERQINSAMSDISSRVNNTIKNAIDGNIDPSNSMTDYIKKNASKDALEKMTNLIAKDVRFQKIVDKLWEKSAKDDYSKESQDEIRKAFLSKAKSLLAPVIKSARNEALRGMGRKVKDDVDEESTSRQREKNQAPERRLSSDKTKAKLDSVKGKTTYEALQALMGD